MFKKIMAVVLGVLMLTGSTVMAAAHPAQAGVEVLVSPRYSYISTCNAKLSISGGKAKITGSVSCSSSVTDIEAEISLQLYDGGSWTEVDSWTDSASDRTMRISETSGSLDKGKYRAVITYTVYAPNGSESSTKTSSTATY